jgi:hypothetical protein
VADVLHLLTLGCTRRATYRTLDMRKTSGLPCGERAKPAQRSQAPLTEHSCRRLSHNYNFPRYLEERKTQSCSHRPWAPLYFKQLSFMLRR